MLIVLCALLVREYRHLQRLNGFTSRQSWLAALHERAPMTAANATFVQTWMTFDYVDHLFNIPSDYFRTTFAITDVRYPRLTIAEYAEDDARASGPATLARVQDAVRAYFASKQ